MSVETRTAAAYAPHVTPPELPPPLRALLATPEPPALDATPRPGTLPVAQIEAQVEVALEELSLSATRRELALGLILLWHDHLEAGHRLAQEVKSADGSFVHAIMHRREPDPWNAKYWWQRVGPHPAFLELARRVDEWLRAANREDLRARLLPGGAWDAAAFTDLCHAATLSQDSADTRALREIQRLETEVLLAHLLARP